MAEERRNPAAELESEEEGLRRQISAEEQAVAEQAAEQAAGVIKPSPKAAVPVAPKAPRGLETPQNSHNLAGQAEAEESGWALDRQVSAQGPETEGPTVGGPETPKPAAAVRGLETPQNKHHLAGQAEAEESGWALDRQVSAQGPAEGPPVRRISENAEREPESPKAALERRSSHDLAAAAEAEEVGWELDRQVSAQEAARKAA